MKIILYIVAIMFVLPVRGQEKLLAQRQYEHGENAYNSGNPEKALQHFNSCLQFNPGYYDAYTSRAAAKEALHDFAGAVTDYSIYLNEFPDHKETTFSRGIARYRAEQYVFAIEDFRRVLGLPNNTETTSIFYRQSPYGGGTDKIVSAQGSIKDMVYNYLGLSYFQLKQYDTAITYFDSALVIEEDPDYFVHRGLARFERKDIKGAESDYRKALQLNEDHALALHNLGVLLNATGKTDSEDQFTRAIERNPELPYPYQERAYQRMNKQDWRGALVDYNKAIEIKKDDPDTWVNRGMVKEKLNDLNGAYKDFTSAIDLRENFEKAWLCRGNVLSKMNRLNEAVEDYTVAITYYPAYASAYYNRAVVRQRLGLNREACDDVKLAEQYGLKVNDSLRGKVCGVTH